jgi:hypothetical protein
MSAHLVSDRHIDKLVTAMIGLKVIERDDADSVGDAMWQENVRSLQEYYPLHYGDGGDAVGDLPKLGSYKFEPAPDENLAGVHVAARGYNYQSCEHDDWESTNSRALNERLCAEIATKYGYGPEDDPKSVRDAIQGLAGEIHGDDGYWSVASRRRVKKLAEVEQPNAKRPNHAASASSGAQGRQPKGLSIGGQFAPKRNAEATVELSDIGELI